MAWQLAHAWVPCHVSSTYTSDTHLIERRYEQICRMRVKLVSRLTAMRLPLLHRPHRQPTVILVVVAAVAVTVADGDNHAMHDVDGGTMRPGNSSTVEWPVRASSAQSAARVLYAMERPPLTSHAEACCRARAGRPLKLAEPPCRACTGCKLALHC